MQVNVSIISAVNCLYNGALISNESTNVVYKHYLNKMKSYVSSIQKDGRQMKWNDIKKASKQWLINNRNQTLL